jgi:ankyrin repeat protein
VHIAVWFGHVELLCLLLRKPEDVEQLLSQREWQGRTPLHIAAQTCCAVADDRHYSSDYSTDCVHELIAAAERAECLEAVLTAHDNEGISAITWLLRVGYPLRVHNRVLPLSCAKVSSCA